MSAAGRLVSSTSLRRVGAAGEVVGIESAPRVAAVAREAVAQRGLANVRIAECDVTAVDLPRESRDFVHARCVLINLPDPARILDAILALVHPGGMTALQAATGG